MVHRQSIRLAASSIVGILAYSAVARADDTSPRTHSSDPPDAYGYVFADDVMRAGAFTPDDPRIVVVVKATRVTLVRPRRAFVAELLKSVENL
jgi:hypothetical protein